MTITKTTTVDNITVDARGIVAVRYLTTYEEDGAVLPGSPVVTGEYINPGDDYAGKDPRVVAMCQLAQTPEVIAAWQAAQQPQEIGA